MKLTMSQQSGTRCADGNHGCRTFLRTVCGQDGTRRCKKCFDLGGDSSSSSSGMDESSASSAEAYGGGSQPADHILILHLDSSSRPKKEGVAAGRSCFIRVASRLLRHRCSFPLQLILGFKVRVIMSHQLCSAWSVSFLRRAKVYTYAVHP